MSSRTYHGELTLGFKTAQSVDDPWLEDETTTQYAPRARTASGSQPISHSVAKAHERAVSQQQRADIEIAKFWQAQAEVQRAKITNRSLQPRWLRVLAVLVGSLLCGAFARVLLSPGAALPTQPSAARASLHIDTRPWSHVFVDDVPLGKTPQFNIQLQPGEHSVRLYNPDRNLLKILNLHAAPGEMIERVEQLDK
jgi:hypothetical protein